MSTRHTVPVLSVLLATLFAAAPAHALYKVVGPDGKITYTDRPAVDQQNKVQPVGERAGGGTNASALPYDLRQVVDRYPVTLYSAENCSSCDAGRQLLEERGIPYVERTVSSNDDAEALKRITGGTGLPSLSVGAQVMRGFQRTDWSSYLDVAGYPKTSKLPANFPKAQKVPMTARQDARPAPAAAAEPAAPVAPATAPAAGPTADNPAGIRF